MRVDLGFECPEFCFYRLLFHFFHFQCQILKYHGITNEFQQGSDDQENENKQEFCNGFRNKFGMGFFKKPGNKVIQEYEKTDVTCLKKEKQQESFPLQKSGNKPPKIDIDGYSQKKNSDEYTQRCAKIKLLYPEVPGKNYEHGKEDDTDQPKDQVLKDKPES